MADKPSRALVVYGDGLARKIEASHTHLHSFASRASCGFLSLPHSPPSETEDARILREFAELLDASESVGNMEEFLDANPQEKHVVSTIAERFMGMRAALVTKNDSRFTCLTLKLGVDTMKFDELVDSSHSVAESQVIASRLLRLLGFENGKTLDTFHFDLVFVRVGAGEEITGLEDIDSVNNLVGALTNMAQPGSEVGSRLHMSVVMSYGAISVEDGIGFPLSVPHFEDKPQLSVLLPRQSYTVKGGKPRENVRHHCPMLIAQLQNAVTRKDMVESYSFEDFKKCGGNLVVPADRFVHEVAFKLWKAPKYGA